MLPAFRHLCFSYREIRKSQKSQRQVLEVGVSLFGVSYFVSEVTKDFRANRKKAENTELRAEEREGDIESKIDRDRKTERERKGESLR